MSHPSSSREIKIVSGGQTGVDRGALDAALACGVTHGGWCPRGRKAEDGVIPEQYALAEADSRAYEARTRLNARDSDGTLVLSRGELKGGTSLTAKVARQMGRPLLIVELDPHAEPRQVVDWLRHHRIHVLNVAGPRESQSLGIQQAAQEFVERVILLLCSESATGQE